MAPHGREPLGRPSRTLVDSVLDRFALHLQTNFNYASLGITPPHRVSYFGNLLWAARMYRDLKLTSFSLAVSISSRPCNTLEGLLSVPPALL